ncbi:chemotaxis protein [Desulfovibrionales bacterium]
MANTNILLESGTNELEIVEFFLDEQGSPNPYRGYYGVNVAKVLEIINLPAHVTALPDARHPSILGAFNQRSTIIPLIDLCVWLDKTRAETGAPKAIVTEFNKIVNAFLVSGVTRIHRLSWEQVESPDSYVAGCTQSSITGVVKIENRIVFLLDLERIIADLNIGLGMKKITKEAPPTAKRYKALVADDSTMIRNLLKEQLTKASFDVQTAMNGRDAWEQLLAIKHRVQNEQASLNQYLDIVVSDIEMPAMDGLSLTKHIKEDPVLSKVPVILFSSLITDKLFHKGQAVGADDQISKPEIEQLAQRAMQLITGQ